MRALLLCKGGLDIALVAAKPGSARGRDELSMRVRRMNKDVENVQESSGRRQQVQARCVAIVGLQVNVLS